MTATLHKTVSGLLWTTDASEYGVVLARKVSEVARFRQLERELPPIERAVLVRAHGLGRVRQSTKEIALELRMGETTVRAIDGRAVARLLNAFGAEE